MLWFLMLSNPVRVRDRLFAVLQGTFEGVELKKFRSLSEAKAYHRQMIMCMNMAVDMPAQLIRIDDQSDFNTLQQQFHQAYNRRLAEHRDIVAATASLSQLWRRSVSKLERLLGLSRSC